MRNYLLLSLCFHGLFPGKSMAQTVPPLMQYQAVARDGSGVIAHQRIPIQVAILKNNPNGTVVYAEVHDSVETNTFGLFALPIGGGTVTTGASLSGIDWGADTYWLRIGFKPPGQSDFLLLNATQLLSVPYALYAEKAGNAVDGDRDSTNELQTLTRNGLNIALLPGGGTVSVADNDNDAGNELIQSLQLSGTTLQVNEPGNVRTVNLAALQDGVDDADADPTNELQTLSLSGTNLMISNGNMVSLAGIGSQWLNNPKGIHYGQPDGNVGIGQSNPENKLVVRGVDSNAEENLVSFGKFDSIGAGRNFLVKMRPAVPEVLLTTDGTGTAHPRLSLGAGAQVSHLTIRTNGNVGIGTDNPDATLQVNGTVKMLGAWEARDPNTTYQAAADGFVVVRLTVTGNNKIRAEAWSGPTGAFTDAEKRAGATAWSQLDASSFTLPVAKGEYWRVGITAQDPAGTNIWVQWRPLGL